MMNYMDKLNIGMYGLAWLSWGKGIIMGIILMMLLGCFIVDLLWLMYYLSFLRKATSEVNDPEWILTLRRMTSNQLTRSLINCY